MLRIPIAGLALTIPKPLDVVRSLQVRTMVFGQISLPTRTQPSSGTAGTTAFFLGGCVLMLCNSRDGDTPVLRIEQALS